MKNGSLTGHGERNTVSLAHEFAKGSASIDYEISTGDIYTIKVPGDNLMILSSRKVMVELLEQRSAIYSDRPHLVMANEMYALFAFLRRLSLIFLLASVGVTLSSWLTMATAFAPTAG